MRAKPGGKSAGVLRLGARHWPCALGHGMTAARKREGDGATPLGTWELRQVFYRPDRTTRPVTGLPVAPLQLGTYATVGQLALDVAAATEAARAGDVLELEESAPQTRDLVACGQDLAAQEPELGGVTLLAEAILAGEPVQVLVFEPTDGGGVAFVYTLPACELVTRTSFPLE